MLEESRWKMEEGRGERSALNKSKSDDKEKVRAGWRDGKGHGRTGCPRSRVRELEGGSVCVAHCESLQRAL